LVPATETKAISARPAPPQIGKRLLELRKQRNLTLEQVERLSGISKSMLSQIERGKANPTFGTLWQLTQSLDVSIDFLVEKAKAAAGKTRRQEHLTIYATPAVTSPDGKCTYRILSPRRPTLPVEWYEVTLEPGGQWRVNPHGMGSWEHMTCITGQVTVEVGADETVLNRGETLRYSGEVPHGTRNDGKQRAIAMLVVTFIDDHV
jgi:transcriptional regulator with XRE-family HTH domain